MQFTIAHSSPVPPFEQLRVQVREQVRGGTLAAGERLPTVRALAETLGLASNTVARAYRELESDGFIETRGRNGSFVSPHGDASRRQAQLAAHEYADRIRQLGIEPGDGLELARLALGQ
jgi:DNA-binding transcriptional regulator YhcF (GntR family)